MASPPKICVLLSGGLDSALLLNQALEEGREVHPLYVACGLPWEELELKTLERFFDKFHHPSLKKLIIQETPIQNIFPELWAFHPEQVPNRQSPTGAIYLPGRNLILLSQATLLAFKSDIQEIWIGILQANPYPDGQPAFFQAFENLYQEAFGKNIKVKAPFSDLSKAQLLKRFPDFPYHLTVTCLIPQDGKHCGDCNKCEERRQAFREAELTDPTVYLKN